MKIQEATRLVERIKSEFDKINVSVVLSYSVHLNLVKRINLCITDFSLKYVFLSSFNGHPVLLALFAITSSHLPDSSSIDFA